MKRFLKISAMALAVGVTATLAGCAGCSGCSGSTKNITVTTSNWFTGTSYKGIQPSFIAEGEYADYSENIIYGVSLDSSSATNKYYSADYKDGSFTTNFYATEYDWSGTYQKYQLNTTELLYCYETELNVLVQFKMKNGETSEWFTDSVKNVSYFRAAGKNLQPVYSKQEITSTSPDKAAPKTLSEAYKRTSVTYENYYDYECTEVTSISTSADGEQQKSTCDLSKVATSVFDNSSLYIAVRSMRLSSSLSQTINLYSPMFGGTAQYSITGAETPLSQDEIKTISAELEKNGLYTPVTADANGKAVEDAGVGTVAVNVNYRGGLLYGTTQTIWYASIVDPDNNESRSTMLKLSVPLSYNLGVLNFTLQEIKSTLWNG